MMRWARRIAGALAVGAASACGAFDHDPLPPVGQIVLGVASDAWLLRSGADPYEVVPRQALFERLRIELFAPGETGPCAECSRDFGIDHRTMNEGRASLGFVPRPSLEGYRARVRLYHSGADESSAEPRASSTLETVVALPPVAPDGILEVHVVLHTDDLGRPRGTLDTPASVEMGPPPRGLAGTWRQEVLQDCAGPSRPDEACVPGGAFWMGDPGFTVPYERLVALSPYFIGTHEVTTGEARASGLAVVDAAAGKADPYLYSSDASTVRHYCTFTQNPDTREDVPVNCVTRDFARRYCAKAGASLVTTAQYEFVAGARRDAAFPWGEATAACADAVFGRTYDATAPAPFRACKALGVGVAKPGTGRLDRVRMPDGKEVVDLAGNVAEWSLDDYQRINEPCNRENPATDPVCREPSPSSPGLLSVRGAAWTSAGGSLLRAAVVSSIPAADQQNTRIGFRCARPGR